MRSGDIAHYHNNGSFLKEREDSHDVGIWTWPGFTPALFIPGPNILVSHSGFTGLELDTLVQR